MIVRGDRLAESERVNALSLEHAGLWALLLSNPKLVDDFGAVRWSAAALVSTLFPRRRPEPIRAVRSLMTAVAKVGLVSVYEVDATTFAHVRAWSGVEPAKQRWHRAPLPLSANHVCGENRCKESGEKVARLWRQHLRQETPASEPGPTPGPKPAYSVPSVPSVLSNGNGTHSRATTAASPNHHGTTAAGHSRFYERIFELKAELGLKRLSNGQVRINCPSCAMVEAVVVGEKPDGMALVGIHCGHCEVEDVVDAVNCTLPDLYRVKASA